MAQVIGVVLAAGAGRRMGTPKAELRVGDRRLIDRAVAVLTGGGCDSVVAVVRAGVTVDGARSIVNPDPDRGMRSSLDLAVVDAATTSTDNAGDGLAVLLVDTPGIGVDAARAVIAHWRRHPDRIAAGRFDGRRGHPTVMTLARWRDAVDLAGPDEGARRYLDAHDDMVDDVDAPGDPFDLDRPADLSTWLARDVGPA